MPKLPRRNQQTKTVSESVCKCNFGHFTNRDNVLARVPFEVSCAGSLVSHGWKEFQAQKNAHSIHFELERPRASASIVGSQHLYTEQEFGWSVGCWTANFQGEII